jgi:hypothetical protein
MLQRNSVAKIYAWPLVIAVVVSLGLTSALIGDDLWDALSWAALLAPVLVFGIGWLKRADTGR